MDSLYIIIPAYNEEENIENIIDDWYPILCKYNLNGHSRMVVIDDGSKDDTYRILCNLSNTREFLIPVTKHNEGHGPTLIYGYDYAIKNGADYIFQTDSDGQTTPKEFDFFWENRQKYDAIIGSRPYRQDGKARVFVEKVLLFILWIIFGVKIPDSNAPFRLMKTDLLKKYLYRLPEKYNLPNVILTVLFAFFNENIRFKRITFKPRQGGKNSINIKKIIKIGVCAVFSFINIRIHIND